MTAAQPAGAARPGLPSAVPPVSVPDALTGALTVIDREARPGLLTLVAPGGAPVCEGDACFVPGAEGVWAEVPD